MTNPLAKSPRPYTKRQATLELPSARDDEILSGMLRLGYMTAAQIRRLWLPTLTDRAVRMYLARLIDTEYIAFKQHGTRRPEEGLIHRGRVYVVTPNGEARAKGIFPEQNLAEQRIIRKDKLDILDLNHGLRYSDVVLRILEALPAMPYLIGVMSESEVVLAPAGRVPRADGLVILRRYSEQYIRDRLHAGYVAGKPVADEMAYCEPHHIPWLRQSWNSASEDQRFYALEIDNDTEPLRTIAEKSQTYRAANATRWWQKMGMPFPVPLWVTPDARRLEKVLRTWIGEWPECIVFGTTWPELDTRGIGHANWVFYNGTKLRTGGRAVRKDRPLLDATWLNLERYDQNMRDWGIAIDDSPHTSSLVPVPLGGKQQ